MKLNATPGFVFWWLYDTSSKYLEMGAPPLEQFLPVEHDRLMRWFRNEEPIDELRLNKALEAFGTDRENYDHLCTL